MISLKNGQSICRFCSLTLQSLKPNSIPAKKNRKVNQVGSKIIDLILGIAAVIAVFPFLIIIFILSKIVPQKRRSEFWDDFSDLP